MTGFYQGTVNGPVGGVSTNDTRPELPYGSTRSRKTGIGRPHNMGDALSSPIGPFDDVESRMFADQDEEINDFDAELENKRGINFSTGDPHANKGSDIGSFVPYANSVAAVIAQGYDRGSETLLREFISEALHEVTSMSVRVMVKGSLGDTYKSSTANTSNVNRMGHKTTDINHKGYGQNVGTKDMYPYVKSGKPTTDGGETMRRIGAHIENEDEFDYNDPDYSSSDHLLDTMTRDFRDQENLRYHNRKLK